MYIPMYECSPVPTSPPHHDSRIGIAIAIAITITITITISITTAGSVPPSSLLTHPIHPLPQLPSSLKLFSLISYFLLFISLLGRLCSPLHNGNAVARCRWKIKRYLVSGEWVLRLRFSTLENGLGIFCLDQENLGVKLVFEERHCIRA